MHREKAGGLWLRMCVCGMLWTNLLLGLEFASSSVQPERAEGRPGYRVGDGRESFLLGICKLVGSVLPPGFRQSQGPFALAGSLTRPAGMTIALSTVLTGQKEERKVSKGREQCSGSCSTGTAPLNSPGDLPTAALAGCHWEGHVGGGKGVLRGVVGSVGSPLHTHTHTHPSFFCI